MDRVNFPMTIDQLIEEAIEAKKKFGGDKFILISNDEEGNGFHECYFTFGAGKDLEGSGCFVPYDLDLENCVILG